MRPALTRLCGFTHRQKSSSGTVQPIGGMTMGTAVQSLDREAGNAMSLSGIRLLQHLSPAEHDELEKKCTFRRFESGDVVLDRFSVSTGVYFAISGTARVVHYVERQEITIATISAGDTIGEISAIDGLHRSASVVAEEGCAVAELPG